MVRDVIIAISLTPKGVFSRQWPVILFLNKSKIMSLLSQNWVIMIDLFSVALSV